MASVSWHSMNAAEVVKLLGTDPARGLDEGEARRRLAEYGWNELAARRRTGPLKIFARQFANYLIVLLLVATVISVVLGEYVDAIAIGVVVLLMGFMGFVQEYRAERTLEALRALASPTCTVVRGGVEKRIQAREVVPGDVVVLGEGDRVPADVRLIEAEDLEVDESALTGESAPAEKDPGAVLPPEAPVGDRVNMAFAGTHVVRGRGKGVVVATGQSTVLGSIARAVAEAPEERSLLEQELDRLGKRMAALVLGVAAVVFALALLERSSALHALMLSISLAVAAVPEGLPVVMTAILALGARKMARRRALVRRLAAIEALGAVDVICTDKTGTLTKGEMTVREVAFAEGSCEAGGTGYEPSGEVSCRGAGGLPQLLARLLAAHEYRDVRLERGAGGWTVRGSPTEGAALVLSHKILGRENVERAAEELRLVKEYPFDRRRKRKTTVHEVGGRYLAVVTGAPEILLGLSSRAALPSGEADMDEGIRARLAREIERMASGGYRTLGVAYRWLEDFAEDADASDVERDLTFLAVLGIIDPPREGVREAVELARRAGVRTIMVTGDHRLTALAVARMIGLDVDEGSVLEGSDLDKMSDEELAEAMERVSVFARVSPEHKERIVRALKARGHRVAMTGDGVNDAPALKAADVGIAMGVRGTEVAKEASQLVLLDDNYATIVEAIREGRAIYDNVKKPVDGIVPANMAEVFTILGSQLAFGSPALEPAQILWVNLVTDSLPAIAYSAEPPEPDVMERPPRADGRLLSAPRIARYAGVGLLIAAFSLLGYYEGLDMGVALAQSSAMTTIVLAEFGVAAGARSERHPLWRLPVNWWMLLAIALSLALQLAALHTPLSGLLGLVPLSPGLWAYAALAALVTLASWEASKLLSA
ncbi:MAG: cation-transporting P-type ATPase [Desulfurococcaceae archaeon]